MDMNKIQNREGHDLVVDDWDMLSGRVMCKQDEWHGSQLSYYDDEADLQADFDNHVRVQNKINRKNAQQ